MWSTTENTAFSIVPHQPLSLLRQEDKMQLRFPGIVTCGLLPEILAEPQLTPPLRMQDVDQKRCGRLGREKPQYMHNFAKCLR